MDYDTDLELDESLPPAIFREPDPSVAALRAAVAPELAPAPKPKDISLEEWQRQTYKQKVRDTFRRAFDRPFTTLDDLLPQRVLVAWRLTRELARIKGFVAADETLSQMIDNGPDFWTHPRDTPRLGTGVSGMTIAARPVEVILQEAEMLRPGYQTIVDLKQRREKAGFALTPPPVPFAYRDGDQVMPNYKPEKDTLLRTWVRLIEALADDLAIRSGSHLNPNAGLEGLSYLIKYQTARSAWPSVMQIVAFESMLVEETLNIFVTSSWLKTQEELRSRYGFSVKEIRQLIGMAKSLARSMSEAPVEDERGMMVLRLEEFIRRCQESLDLRAELGGLKQLAIVMGLARVEPNDSMRDIIGIIAEGSRQRKEGFSGAGRLPAGPQGEIID